MFDVFTTLQFKKSNKMSPSIFIVVTDFRIREKTESIKMKYGQYCKLVIGLLNQSEFFNQKLKF